VPDSHHRQASRPLRRVRRSIQKVGFRQSLILRARRIVAYNALASPATKTESPELHLFDNAQKIFYADGHRYGAISES
jgi:hypothetical protein